MSAATTRQYRCINAKNEKCTLECALECIFSFVKFCQSVKNSTKFDAGARMTTQTANQSDASVHFVAQSIQQRRREYQAGRVDTSDSLMITIREQQQLELQYGITPTPGMLKKRRMLEALYLSPLEHGVRDAPPDTCDECGNATDWPEGEEVPALVWCQQCLDDFNENELM